MKMSPQILTKAASSDGSAYISNVFFYFTDYLEASNWDTSKVDKNFVDPTGDEVEGEFELKDFNVLTIGIPLGYDQVKFKIESNSCKQTMRYFLSANKNMTMYDDPSLAFAVVLNLPNQRHDLTSTKMGVKPAHGSEINLDVDLKAMIALYPDQKIFLVFVCPYWELGINDMFEVEVNIRKPGTTNTNTTDTNNTSSTGKSPVLLFKDEGPGLYSIFSTDLNAFGFVFEINC